jgi:tryptophan halogenase
MKATKGSSKLRIEFVDWAKVGHRYFHPFGEFGKPFDLVPVHQHWLAARASGCNVPLDDLAMAWGAGSRDRFAKPPADPHSIGSTFSYAYPFDAGLYAKFLRSYAEARGVVRHEGKVVSTAIDGASGHATSVTLDDGRVLEADLSSTVPAFAGC